MRTCCIALLALILIAACGPGEKAFEAKIALRYATQQGRTVLLEVAPLEVGDNHLRITVLDSNARPAAATASVRLSRPESGGPVAEATARSAAQDRLEAHVGLDAVGWWQTEVVLNEKESASFFFRVDPRAKPPLETAPPDHESDPQAEAVYRSALQTYQSQIL